MSCAWATDSSAPPRRGGAAARCARPGRAGVGRLSAMLLAATLLTALGGCQTLGLTEAEDTDERTVFTQRRGDLSIQVTEATRSGNRIVRVRTVQDGEENSIVLDIQEDVYEVEVPLSMDQVLPRSRGGAGAAGGAAAAGGDFRDILVAQYLERAQQLTLEGDYNGALRQVNTVLQVDPENVSALSMKGSIYYAMGNYELANEEWQEVLALDPSNREVQQFMEFMQDREGAPQPPLPGTEGAQAPAPPAQGGGQQGGSGSAPPQPGGQQ